MTAAFFTLFCVGSFQLKERVYSSTLHLGASLLASRFDRGQSQNPDADVAGSATVLILQYVFSIYVLYYIYLNLFCFISIVSYTVQYGFIYRILYLLNVILVYIYIRIHIIHETDSENAPKELKRLYTFVHWYVVVWCSFNMFVPVVC